MTTTLSRSQPRIDPASVPGWGVDADPRNDPTYPMRDRSAEPPREAGWPRPPAQATDMEVLQSVEYNDRPAVFGTGPAPAGVSGMLRRAAFRFSENDWWHWLLLLGADRVDMVEGLLADAGRGKVPNIPAETGTPAAWAHDRAGVITRVAAISAATAAVAILMSRRQQRMQRPQRMQQPQRMQRPQRMQPQRTRSPQPMQRSQPTRTGGQASAYTVG